MTGFFRRVLPGAAAAAAGAHALRAGRDDRPHPVRAGEAVSRGPPGADARRRPLPARARQRRADREDRGRPRARRARARRCSCADSDPRPTDEILALFGVAPQPGLRRAAARASCTGAGRSACPRAALPGPRRRSPACAALRRGAVVFTRDLQLADLLLRLRRRRAASCTRRTRWRRSCTGERGALYGTAETADARQGATRLRRARGAGVAAGARRS